MPDAFVHPTRMRWVNVYANGWMSAPFDCRGDAVLASRGDHRPVYRLCIRFKGPARTRPNGALGILQHILRSTPVEPV